MKITQMMLAKGFGGAERYFVDLCLALADLGHEVQAICHHRFYGRELLAGDPRIELESFNVLGWWDLIAYRNISSAVAYFAPEVMHAHLARAAYIGGKVRRRTHIPLAVKTHNYVDLKYYRDVDLFLPTTRDQRRYLIENGIAEERIQVVPNFSSLPVCDEIQAGFARKPAYTFGAMGRLVKKKGFGLLVNAFKQSLDQGLEGQLIIGGDGPEQADLEDQITRLNCTDRIRLCGWVDDVESFLSSIDVFVLPSLDEPFGIVILEAMARGKAIISTRTRGPAEILDESTALLVEAGQAQELGNALIEITAAPEQARSRAINALNKFRDQYSKDRVVPGLVGLYQQMIQGASD